MEEETGQHCVEFAKVEECEYDSTNVEESVTKTSHITKEVQHAVSFSVDQCQIKVYFICYCNMSIVYEVVWAQSIFMNCEEVRILFFCNLAPLPVVILKL